MLECHLGESLHAIELQQQQESEIVFKSEKQGLEIKKLKDEVEKLRTELEKTQCELRASDEREKKILGEKHEAGGEIEELRHKLMQTRALLGGAESVLS